MSEIVKKGAMQYVSYITENIPQTNGEKINYYFSGSIAMILLSTAKKIKPVTFDSNAEILNNSPEIEVSDDAKQSFSNGVRQLSSDVDIVEAVEGSFMNGSTGKIYNLGAVRNNCNLASSLCPAWERINGTMYFDVLSHDREITGHNVTILELENGKKVLVTNPIDLMVHKFSEMLVINLSREKLAQKYDKDVKDLSCLFNGIAKLGMIPENFKSYLENLIQINKSSTVNNLQYKDFSERLSKILEDVMPHIEKDSKEIFNKLIEDTKTFNQEQLSKTMHN